MDISGSRKVVAKQCGPNEDHFCTHDDIFHIDIDGNLYDLRLLSIGIDAAVQDSSFNADIRDRLMKLSACINRLLEPATD